MKEWFCYVTCFAKGVLLLFSFSLKYVIFIIKKLFYDTHYVDVWKCEFDTENRIENYYHHDIKKYILKQSKRKDVLVIFMLKETKNSNLLDKNCT